MPWCPKCKSEFREGFTVCSDCGSALVEEQFMEPAGQRMQMSEQQDREVREEELSESVSVKSDVSTRAYRVPVYQDSSEKANENSSSAWILLSVGTLGMLAIVLGIMDVIPLRFNNDYLGYGVMAAIFILFFVSGVVSMKNAKIFRRKAESENSLRNTMLDWCKENLHGEEMDRQIRMEGKLPETEEIWYFRRSEYIKGKLNYQFVNLDQDFLDRFIDDYVYDLVYGRELEMK